jgi:predicted transcriptional regulator
MQDLCKLLFELSNEDRFCILSKLRSTPMKLTRVAEKFQVTVPETARNLSRLNEANLIAKDFEGLYHLTPFGEEALRLLSGLQFLSKNKKYFISHTLGKLPQESAISLGALEESKPVKEMTEMFFVFEKIFREAQEYVWFSADQILASILPLIVDGIKRGVEFKKLMPSNVHIPDDMAKMVNDPIFDQAARMGKLESRYLDNLDVVIFISEKEVSAICFPDPEGKFDYLGFISKSEMAHSWCKSLFSNYWNLSKK